MKILIVGGGGREHAIGWALARSRRRPELTFAPGNAGTAALGRNIDTPADDVEGLLAYVRSHDVDLTVVGPEVPLVAGLVDRLREAGRAVVGPTAAAARLEGSKAFAKAFMARHGIPTAAYRAFSADQYDDARAYVDAHPLPLVLKADGLAAGKGVLICTSREEAARGLDAILRDRRFGEAGAEVVVEAFMTGEEASVFAVTDGTRYDLLASAQDHKRIGEGDTGPNTGGMGAYAPAPVATPEVMEQVRERIIEPTLKGMAAEGYPYTGFLYCGLMITSEGPKVVEFNCRLGDPETQVVLPLLETDFVDLLQALVEDRLDEVEVTLRPGAAACVVMASGGYPGPYTNGRPIAGLGRVGDDHTVVFHAGTQATPDGVVTSGGRVLAVTGLGHDLPAALDAAYRGVDRITFEDQYVRRDIGQKGLARLAREG